MLILGVNTATPELSVAVLDDVEGLKGEFSLKINPRTHSEKLLPLIDDLLIKIGIRGKDLGALAVTVGPGSFTGLRVGLATVKGLARVWRLPLIGVPTLDVLASNLNYFPGEVWAVLSARRDECYAAGYSPGAAGLNRISPFLAINPVDLAIRLQVSTKPLAILGDGVPVLRQAMASNLIGSIAWINAEKSFVRAANLAILGLRQLQLGEVDDLDSIAPLYIRPSPAEAVLDKANHGR